MITKNTLLEELYDMAIDALSKVKVNETFIVRDLFTGLEWNRIPKGLRTKLGSLFLMFAKKDERFEENGKTPQNQQIYIRVK